MTDSVVWIRSNGRDSWEEPLPPSEQTVSARVEFRTRVVRNFAGDEVTAAGTVLLSSKPGPEDKLRIDGIDRAVLGVQEVRSFRRVSHYEVFVA